MLKAPYSSRSSRRAILGGISAIALAMLLSGCQPYPFSPIKPVGNVARQDDNLYEVVTVMALCVFAIVGGLIIYSSFRFRRPRTAGDQDPRQVFGNTPLEMTWTFIPIVIVALLFTLAVQTLQATTVPTTVPKGGVEINVIGHQWVWEYQYPQYHIDYFQASNQAVAVDGMHIPSNTPVILNITGADVQHGWWVPALAGKNEAIPGHWNHQEFVANTVGTYYAVCSYYCGIQHYNMLANVVVQTHSDFAAWLKKMTPAPAPAVQPTVASSSAHVAAVAFKKDIESIFSAHCATCHIQQQFGGLNLANYQGLLKGGNIVPGSLVTAGDHTHSYLWQIVQPNPPWPGGNRMPLGGPYLSPTLIQTIATWIDQGAKNN